MQNKIQTVIQRIGFSKKLFFLVFPVVFLFFYPEGAHAASAWEWVSNPVGQAFKGLLYAVFVVIGWFTSVAITMFAYVVDPQNISGPKGMLNLQAVYDMWKFVRDFINIFFILGLLFIAFAFVFQIKEYSEPKVIIKLIIAALLVNFSFPVARIIIDLANVPMYFFLQMILGDGANASTALSSSLGASNLQAILLPKEDSSDVSSLLAAIIFLFIFNITILVLAFQLLIRLIALIILVILSPIGFVASGIPGLKKYGTQWWDNFLKYCFFGPAAIFMLVLATNFFAAISNGDNQNTVGSLASENSADPGFIASMVLFFVPIVMLWFVIGMSGKFSIAGASIATDYGKKFAKWAGKTATVKPVKFIGRKADSKLASNKYGKYVSPGAWKAALKHRAEEQKHYDEQPIKLAGAAMQDQLNTGLSVFTNTINPFNLKNRGKWGVGTNTDKSDHRFAQRQQQKQEYKKEISGVSERSDFVIHELKDAILQGNAAKVEGAVDILLGNNDMNDMMQAMSEADLAQIGFSFDGLQEGKDYTKDEQGKKTLNLSSKNYNQLLNKLYDTMGIGGEEKAKAFMHISDKAQAAGNFALGGLSRFKEDGHGHGEFKVNDHQAMGQGAAAKFANLEAQAQARALHPDTLVIRDKDGQAVDLNDEMAAAVIGKISKATADQSNRSRGDMQEQIVMLWQKAQKGEAEQFRKTYKENENFRYYVAKMLEQQNINITGDKQKDGIKSNAGIPVEVPTRPQVQTELDLQGGSNQRTVQPPKEPSDQGELKF